MRTLTERADAVRDGRVSPVDLVRTALDAIDRIDTELNAFTHVFPDAAVDEAARLAETEPLGPLHGVPVAVKELYDVAGSPTTGCCAAFHDRVASRDSAAVQALRDAGAVVVAKTNQHEIALGTTTQLSSFGPGRNPWDPERIPGGSSGGSGAAVAAGAVAMAMGSDTGGSIRIPSAFCGITGLKPTHGAVSLRGAMPLAPSMDTLGPLAVSAHDCALVHRVLAGFDPDDRYSRDGQPVPPPERASDVRIALPRRFFRSLHPEIAEAVHGAARTFEGVGAVLDEVEGPDPEGTRDRLGPVLLAEAAHHFPELLSGEGVTPETSGLLQLGAGLSASDYVAAREAALTLRRDFEWALTTADALLAPVTPFVAPRVDAEEVEVGEGVRLPADAAGATRFTLLVNAVGLPSLALPVGFSSEGLPIGAQLIGRDWSEEALCALGAAYQDATDWHLRQPPSFST